MLRQWNIFLFFFSTLVSRLNAWSFQDSAGWVQDYPACGGSYQSPIDFTSDILNTMEEGEGQIEFADMDQVPKHATLHNNGHELVIEPEWDESPPTLSGGPLRGNYVLERILIRWPDEHTIRGISHPLALHSVYHNDNFDSWTDALGHRNGVVEVVYSFHAGSESDVFNIILNNTENVLSTFNDEASITPFALSALKTTSKIKLYITYEGSFSIPPCYEPVTWIISAAGYELSQDQIDKIVSTQLANGDTSNARPTQPIDDRVATFYTGNM